MNPPQSDDDPGPHRPGLIPPDRSEAERRLDRIAGLGAGELARLDAAAFLAGWWALHWLRPGLHPDDVEDWPEDAAPWRPLAEEAFRRFEAGGITDAECYPAAAVHDRLRRELGASPGECADDDDNDNEDDNRTESD